MKDLTGSIELEVDGELFAVDLSDLQGDLRINRADLREDLERQPALYAWIATLAAQADFNVGRSKQALTALKAALGKELRGSNLGKGRGDPTRIPNDGIEEAVESDPAVLELSDELVENVQTAAILGGFREALRQRSQMLQSLALIQRGEMYHASE